MLFLEVFLLCSLIFGYNASRIFAVFPTPSISHQIVFRPFILELVRRGHEIVMVTADPIFPKGKSPPNLREIDVHDISYQIWREHFVSAAVAKGKKDNIEDEIEIVMDLMCEVFEHQVKTKEFQELIKSNLKFDLLILEAYLEPLLALSHIFKAPVIHLSSMGSSMKILETNGAPIHPLLYPTSPQQKTSNFSDWDKIKYVYGSYRNDRLYLKLANTWDVFLQRVFGPNIPPLVELKKNVDMIFLNSHPFWEGYRPLPHNVIYIGGLHHKPEQALPKDLKAYLDSSRNGVIYVSFGTNVNPTLFESQQIGILVEAFSKVPFDVVWKWNNDTLPGQTENIMISKWLPQSDLLRHPKIKLFITQGGLQSTDEAISAGVPLLGIPMFGDQWFNVAQYVKLNIGVKVDLDTITVKELTDSIFKVINDKSYRKNISHLRKLSLDNPMTPLERAIWWTEYVLRHKGAKHLHSPAAHMHWSEYYELKLVAYVLLVVFLIIFIVCYTLFKIFKLILCCKKRRNFKRKWD